MKLLILISILGAFCFNGLRAENKYVCCYKVGAWESYSDSGVLLEKTQYFNLDSCICLDFHVRTDTIFDAFGNDDYIVTIGYDSPRVGTSVTYYDSGDTMDVRYFESLKDISTGNKEIRSGTHKYFSENNCLLYTETYISDSLISRVFSNKKCE